MKIRSNLSLGAFIKPVQQVNKKTFNIKAWHFWKSFRYFVCSVLHYVAGTTSYKYIFVLHQYQCHDGILFPTFTAVLSSPTATQFSQSTLFPRRMELMLSSTLLSSNKRIKTGFNFFMLIHHLTHQYQVTRVHYSSDGWVQI